MSPRKLFAPFAAGALVLSACGGGDDDATEADELVDDADDAADAGDELVDEPDGADHDDTIDDGGDGGDDDEGAAGSEAFCAGIVEIAEFAAETVVDISPDAPFEVRQDALVELWRGMEERLRSLEDVPEQIADDLEIFVDFLGDATDEIEGFSSEEEVDAFFADEPDEVAEADLRLEAFALDECGITLF